MRVLRTSEGTQAPGPLEARPSWLRAPGTQRWHCPAPNALRPNANCHLSPASSTKGNQQSLTSWRRSMSSGGGKRSTQARGLKRTIPVKNLATNDEGCPRGESVLVLLLQAPATKHGHHLLALHLHLGAALQCFTQHPVQNTSPDMVVSCSMGRFEPMALLDCRTLAFSQSVLSGADFTASGKHEDLQMQV
jgi:hypothetical protein